MYRGARLGTAGTWAASHAPDLSATARQFLGASRSRARRTGIIVRVGVAALAVLTVVTTITSIVALRQRSAAIAQRDSAVYSQVLAEAGLLTDTDPAAAAEFLVAAYHMRPSPALQSRLISTENLALPALVQTSGPVNSVAASQGSPIIATSSYSAVMLWDIARPARPQEMGHPLTVGLSKPVSAIAVSPDGRTLAIGDGLDRITLWDIASPGHPRRLGPPVTAGKNWDAWKLAFSPDGHILASVDLSSGGGGNSITLWNAASPAHLRVLSHLAIPGRDVGEAVAFSPDGHILGVATDMNSGNGAVILWDVADPARPQELGQATSSSSTPMNSVAFSSDGRMMVSGSEAGQVLLWDISSPADPRTLGSPLSAGSDGVVATDFSPDGHTIAAVSEDGTVSRWDITSPADPQPLGQPTTSGNTNVAAAAFSPGDQSLVTGSQDGTIAVSPFDTATIQASPPPSANCAFSPNGKTLASVSVDGGVSLWNISDLSRPRQVGQIKIADDDTVNLVAFSPDGKIIAIQTDIGAGPGTAITLWDVTNPARPRELGPPLNAGSASAGVDTAAFSPDGRMLAIGNANDTVTLWDVTNPSQPRLLLPQLLTPDLAPVSALAFGPGGRLLAGVTQGGNIALWKIDTSSYAPVTGFRLKGNAYIESEAISPRGHTLAVTSGVLTLNGSTVTLWDISNPSNPRQLGQPLTDEATSLAYSPDGLTLAIASQNNTVTLWDVAAPARPQQTGQTLSTADGPTESVVFSPQGNTLATTSQDGTVHLWDLNISYAINQICNTTTITPQQWRQYLPQVPYQPPCS